MLWVLNGHCNSPIAGHATLDGNEMTLTASVLDEAGGGFIEVSRQGPADRPREASLRGNRIAQRLLPAGGIRRDAMAVHTRMESFANAAEQTAKAERAIQEEIDRKEKARGKPEKDDEAMQAGARRYPQPPGAMAGPLSGRRARFPELMLS